MSGGAPALPARLLGVFDPRGRAGALDARFARLLGAFDAAAWRIARIDGQGEGQAEGRGAGGDPAARWLRLAVLVPGGAAEDPGLLIRRRRGGLAAGNVRLFDPPPGAAAPRAPGGAPLSAAAADLDRLLEAEAAGAFADRAEGPAPLEGDFALALLDFDGPRLRLLRDPTGQAGLNFARLPDGAVAFSDWIHPLRALGETPGEPDREAVELFMTFRRLTPGRTVWPGIEETPPGAEDRFDAAGGHARRLHRRIGPDAALAGLDDAGMLEAIRDRARAAVLRRARRLGDAPGVMFSGGLDSSLVAGLLCAADPTREVRAWSNISAAGAAPEEAAAREAMRRRWPNLTLNDSPAADLDPLSGAEDWWRRRAAPNPDLFAWTMIGLHRRMLEGGCDAAIGGQTGDRLVSSTLLSKLRADLAGLRPGGVAQEVRALRDLGLSWRRLVSMTLVKPSPLYALWRRRRPGREVLGRIPWSPDAGTRAAWEAAGFPPWFSFHPTPEVEERANLEQCAPWTYEDPLLFEGVAPGAPPAALAYGAPLIDTRLTSAVMAAPLRMKSRDGQSRGVIRALLAELAPPEVARRRDKAPFQPDLAAKAAETPARLRAALPGFARLEMWREMIDRPRLEAGLDRLEAGLGAGRLPMRELSLCMNAWFLGEFLRRAEEDAAVPARPEAG